MFAFPVRLGWASGPWNVTSLCEKSQERTLPVELAGSELPPVQTPLAHIYFWSLPGCSLPLTRNQASDYVSYFGIVLRPSKDMPIRGYRWLEGAHTYLIPALTVKEAGHPHFTDEKPEAQMMTGLFPKS